MKKYIVILWYTSGCKEFSLVSDRYPMYRDIVLCSGIKEDDIISYEVED